MVPDRPIPARSPAGNSPLRIALVGGGKMGKQHARAIGKLAPGVQLVAVADPNPAAAKPLQSEFPELKVYPDLPALLAAERPDVVHIVTPPATHAALARQALEGGAHVYVEKPVVDTVAEATELLALAAATGRLICAGHQLMYEPPAQVLRQYRPAIGRLVHIESYFSFRTTRRTPDGRTPLRADLQLLDILPHPVYLLLDALAGEPGDKPELLSVEVGPAGTIHALVRKGMVTGNLVVTLEGRPVDNWLRLTGTNGTLHADFVRSTMQRSIGPGTSGIDKLFAPYRQARQLVSATTRSMARRFLGGQRSYPGLSELFAALYDAIRTGQPSPVSPENILGTVEICERVSHELRVFQERIRPADNLVLPGTPVVLSGGTGFLGKAVVRQMVAAGHPVTVLARRDPPAWEQIAGARYLVTDLGAPLDPAHFKGAGVVVHAAAETAGGWEQHQRNSIDAAEHVLRAAAAAGVPRFLHISSLAVLSKSAGPTRDDTPLEADSRGTGPYVWGKLESERLVLKLGSELGMEVKVMRPAAIVDYGDFDPPGRLGKRLGNFFVAIGSPGDKLGTVDLSFCARAITWAVDHFAEAPAVVNLVDPALPTKRTLVAALRKNNPDLSVIWLPMFVVHPLSWGALVLQKVLRPGKPAVNVAKVFSVERIDPAGAARLSEMLHASSQGAAHSG